MMSAQKNSILLLEKEIKNMTKKLTTTYEFFIFCDFCTKIRYIYHYSLELSTMAGLRKRWGLGEKERKCYIRMP